MHLDQICQKNVKEVSIDVKCQEIVCYLLLIMNKIIQYIYRSGFIVAFIVGICSCSKESNHPTSESIKVSVRDVGHHLLLANNDSTSVVKPVVDLGDQKYQLSFDVPLSIEPDSLVTIIKQRFQKAGLPTFYLVEVIQCDSKEVSYSYEMKQDIDKGIIPCRGRELHKACYTITIRFTKGFKNSSNYTWILLLLAIAILTLLVKTVYNKKSKGIATVKNDNYTSIGKFKFYQEENKLVKEAVETSLSKKECELLAIFIAHPNQILKREILTKKVWEDNGVFVGRSLDTYISKLRKILKDDDSIQLINIHGVGYKLEILSL